MIDILMATYNGEKFLRQQLDSILQQTCQDWQLVIADDCSKDNTAKILQEYQEKYPTKISYHINSKPSGSAKNNFYQLLSYGKSEYIMLADQDDVWLENKLELTLAKMQELEKKHGSRRPLLVHTDLRVVNQDLEEINPSLFAMQAMEPQRDKLNHLIVTNIVTGCTTMVNRALMGKLTELPKTSVMHDMWLALVAAAFGEIGFVKEPTILYRQHGNNTEGAKNVKSLKYYAYKIVGAKEIHKNLVAQYNQAGEFLRIYGAELSQENQDMLLAYSQFENKSILAKYAIMKRYNLFKTSKIKVMGQLLR